MARPGVTYPEVAAAAQQLMAAGKAPTLDNLRGILGTGSHTTLSAHLRRWKGQQDDTHQIAHREHLPEVLIATLKGLWIQTMDHADAKIHQIEHTVQAERSTFHATQHALEGENAQWQQRHRGLQQERDALLQEKGVLESLLTQSQISLAVVEQKNAGLIQQYQDVQHHLEELRRQNQQIQANLEHYRAASQEQRLAEQQRHTQLQQQLEESIRHLNHTVHQTTQDQIAWQQQAQQTAFEKEALKTQLEKIEAQHSTTKAQLTEAREALVQAMHGQQQWRDLYHALTTKAETQQQECVTLQAQYAQLREQHQENQQTLHTLREQNKNLAHEKWIIAQEKSQLQGQLKQMQSML